MRKSKNRIGESNIANNGQVMTIIEYKNYKDIDILYNIYIPVILNKLNYYIINFIRITAILNIY